MLAIWLASIAREYLDLHASRLKAVAMAKVVTKYQLTWKDSPRILLSEDTLVSHENQMFFKMRASHWQVLKLLCGFTKKNASFAHSTTDSKN